MFLLASRRYGGDSDGGGGDDSGNGIIIRYYQLMHLCEGGNRTARLAESSTAHSESVYVLVTDDGFRLLILHEATRRQCWRVRETQRRVRTERSTFSGSYDRQVDCPVGNVLVEELLQRT